ncbi:MAG: hypothetical protein O7C62_00005, partial [Rickettsia endosymbiont of Ixodes persulcatus]|nr:hypothetical protein [Rickettsia endosymbiont of Ixodes persulcatus]
MHADVGAVQGVQRSAGHAASLQVWDFGRCGCVAAAVFFLFSIRQASSTTSKHDWQARLAFLAFTL